MERTRVAVLGTLAEFHTEPIPYDIRALVRLVTDVRPELLCLEITSEQWQQRDFVVLPPDYRDGLLPLAHQTDIVVVPIAGDHAAREPTAMGWRGILTSSLRGCLIALQVAGPRRKLLIWDYGIFSPTCSMGASPHWPGGMPDWHNSIIPRISFSRRSKQCNVIQDVGCWLRSMCAPAIICAERCGGIQKLRWCIILGSSVADGTISRRGICSVWNARVSAAAMTGGYGAGRFGNVRLSQQAYGYGTEHSLPRLRQ